MNLQTDLTANGQFANYAGALTTFGRQNYPGHGTVIGVRLPGGWQIFAQSSNDLFETLRLPAWMTACGYCEAFTKSLGAKSFRSRRQVCHSCDVPGDS